MGETLTYDDGLVIVERAIDRYKNVLLIGRPDDPCETMGGILHRVIAADWPGIAAEVTPADLAQIDRGASGHSDYHHKMALRIHRLAKQDSRYG